MKRIAVIIVMIFSIAILCSCQLGGGEETSKNVPVYQGMKITRNDTKTISDRYYSDDIFLSLNSADVVQNDGNPPLPGGEPDPLHHHVPEGFPPEDNHHRPHDEIENDIEEIVNIDVITDDEVKNFVQASETFILEVYISNPENYEIQSFTLNGNKYANYMFRTGSTMELLLLEVEAPENPGYYAYTIDAIKYIDGTSIKDVDMSKAEKSIKVGVEYTNLPSADVTNIIAIPTSISFDVNITDQHGLIGENAIAAYLSDGENIIDQKELTIGENSVTFDNLYVNKMYEYGIATSFDQVDGRSVHEEWLYKASFSTSEIFTFNNVNIGKENVTFNVDQNGEKGTIKSLAIYDATTGLVLDATYDVETKEFAYLLSNHDYKLYIDYEYNVGEETVNDWTLVSFTTLAKVEPDASIISSNITKTSVGYTINSSDIDHILTIHSVDLYLNNELVKNNEVSLTGSFTDLFSDNEYTIKLTYSYDLNDGAGAKEVTKEITAKTLAKQEPSVAFSSSVADKTSITYVVDTIDSDNILSINSVDLYLNGQIVKTNEKSLNGSFTDLLSNNEYTLKVSYAYDLNDGTGVKEDSKEVNAKTLAKAEPILSIESLFSNNKEYLIFDENGVVTGLKDNSVKTIYIDSPIADRAFKDNTNIETIILGPNVTKIGEQAFYCYDSSINEIIYLGSELPEFVSDTFGYIWSNGHTLLYVQDEFYDSIINASSNDSYWNDLKQGFVAKFSTLSESQKELINNISSEIKVTNASINYKYSLTDNDGVITGYSAKLYDSQGNLVKDNESNLEGVFSNLLSNNEYTLKVSYSYDLNDGTGVKEITKDTKAKTLAKAKPILDIARISDPLNGIESLEYSLINGGTAYSVSGVGSFRGDVVVLGGYYNGLPITRIESHSLINCSWIKEAIILDTVESIGYEIFYGIDIQKVFFQSKTVPSMEYNIFGYNSPDVYVPDEAFNDYNSLNDALWINNIYSNNKLHRISEYTNSDEFYNGNYDLQVTQSSIKVRFAITDLEQVGSISKVELISNGITEKTIETFDNILFETLLSNHEYTIKLTYSYDLNDGTGVKEDSKEVNAKTLAKAEPILSIESLFSKNKEYLNFDENGVVTGLKDDSVKIVYIDSPIADYAFKNNTTMEIVVLGPNVTRIGREAFYSQYSNIDIIIYLGTSLPEYVNDTFGYIWSNGHTLLYVQDEFYDSIINASSNDSYWNDLKQGFVAKFSNLTESQKEIINSIGNANISARKNAIVFEYDITDVDDVISSQYVELHDSEGNVISKIESEKSGTFNNLEQCKTYKIMIAIEYNLNDGKGVQTVIVEKEVTINKLLFDYEINDDNSIDIISYVGSASEVIIPNAIDGLKVKKVAANTFANASVVTKLVFTDTTIDYEKGCLTGLDNVTTIIVPEGMNKSFVDMFNVSNGNYLPESFENVIFDGFSSWNETLFAKSSKKTYNISHVNYTSRDIGKYENVTAIKSFIIPDGVATIWGGNFCGCVNLEYIYIPDSVTFIAGASFADCIKLTSIVIPDSVTKIDDGVFGRCTSLTSITLSNRLTTISGYLFADCTALKSIVIPDSVTKIDNSAFERCTSLENVDIPDSVTSIGNYAFKRCESLKSIILPESIMSIGESAFAECELLDGIVIPESVDKIEANTFNKCYSLTTITLPDEIEKIGNYAFADCTGLSAFVVPDSVETIGSFAFGGCTNLISIDLGNGLLSIEEYAFYDCTGLTHLVLPASLEKVANYILQNCSSMACVSILSNETVFKKDAFYNCPIQLFYFAGTESEWLEIGFTSLEDYVMIEYESEVNELSYVIEDGIAYIKNDKNEYVVFARIVNADQTSYTLKEGIRLIRGWEFSPCRSAKTVSIPVSVSSIGEWAFANCHDIDEILYNGTIEQWNTIEKGNCWDGDNHQYVIHCTNGDIEVN